MAFTACAEPETRLGVFFAFKEPHKWRTGSEGRTMSAEKAFHTEEEEKKKKKREKKISA